MLCGWLVLNTHQRKWSSMSSCSSSSFARFFRLQDTVKYNNLSMMRNCGLRNMSTNAFHTELDMPSHRAKKRTWPDTAGTPPTCSYAMMDISGVQHTQNDTINTNDVTCVGLDRFSDSAVTYSCDVSGGDRREKKKTETKTRVNNKIIFITTVNGRE